MNNYDFPIFICTLIAGKFNNLLGPHRKRPGVMLLQPLWHDWDYAFYMYLWPLLYSFKACCIKKVSRLQDELKWLCLPEVRSRLQGWLPGWSNSSAKPLWLLGEWLLSAQHWIFGSRDVEIQGGCFDQERLILRKVIGLGTPEVHAWCTQTHTHNPGYSGSSIWYVAGRPWHRTVCSKATPFKTAIC